MPGLTRKETHAQTRARLVETAQRLWLETGYNATSLLQVAEAAGYTKGAVYSNFATKHELGLAVLEAVQQERVDSLVAAFEGAPTLDERIEAFAHWAETHIGDVGWTALEVEFATSTRHLDDVRAALAERRRLTTDLLAGLLQGQADELGVPLPASADAVATHLLSLGIGLGVQRAFDSSLGIDVLVEQVRSLTRG
jgi:AcrR family transcriptional regulator